MPILTIKMNFSQKKWISHNKNELSHNGNEAIEIWVTTNELCKIKWTFVSLKWFAQKLWWKECLWLESKTHNYWGSWGSKNSVTPKQCWTPWTWWHVLKLDDTSSNLMTRPQTWWHVLKLDDTSSNLMTRPQTWWHVLQLDNSFHRRIPFF